MGWKSSDYDFPGIGGGYLTSALRINFRVRHDELKSGFAMGELCLENTSSGAKECFSTMVLVSATLLLDQLAGWRRDTPSLRFNPIDCSAFVEFLRTSSGVVVKARGQDLGLVEEDALIQAAFLGCSNLLASISGTLSKDDAGRHDLEAALSEFSQGTLH